MPSLSPEGDWNVMAGDGWLSTEGVHAQDAGPATEKSEEFIFSHARIIYKRCSSSMEIIQIYIHYIGNQDLVLFSILTSLCLSALSSTYIYYFLRSCASLVNNFLAEASPRAADEISSVVSVADRFCGRPLTGNVSHIFAFFQHSQTFVMVFLAMWNPDELSCSHIYGLERSMLCSSSTNKKICISRQPGLICESVSQYINALHCIQILRVFQVMSDDSVTPTLFQLFTSNRLALPFTSV